MYSTGLMLRRLPDRRRLHFRSYLLDRRPREERVSAVNYAVRHAADTANSFVNRSIFPTERVIP